MRDVARLYDELDSTTSTSAKVEHLREYFGRAEPADAAWVLAFLLGHRLKGVSSTKAVARFALEEAGIPKWLFDECRASVGDLSETVMLLLQGMPSAEDEPPSVSDVVTRYIQPLAGASEARREALLREVFGLLDSHERFVYLKMLRGGFRVGVQRRLVSRAIGELVGVEQATIERRLAGGFEPDEAAYRELLEPESAAELQSRPYPFFLAHAIGVEEVVDESSLGPIERWLAEWKWDGIRVQILVREHGVQVWSRGEEPIGHQFPEVVQAAGALPAGVALDGELLMWEGERPLGFAELQTRLNRSVAPPAQLGLFDEKRIVVQAYDLLEFEGEDVRGRPLHERRAALAELLASDAQDVVIRRSPLVEAKNWAKLGELRTEARSRGVEGLMLKHRDSTYGSGRVKPVGGPGWLKWKLEPRSVDAVLVNAYPGSGRRASLYTDYGFAVWDEAGEALQTFARAYSGLTNDEIEELDRWIRSNTAKTLGPVRVVEPSRVFEIGFEGIARSKRHKSGVAVRFPRILRERTDKPAEEADNMSTLLAMLRESQ